MNKSVQRTIEILNYIAEDSGQNGVGISQISHMFGIPKSSASDVLYSLLELGFLTYRNEEMKTFELGNRAIRFGVMAVGQFGLTRMARPELEALNADLGFTVMLGIRSDDRMLIVDKIEGRSAVHLTDGIGTHKLMHLTSIGKVLLSGYSDEEVLDIVGDSCLETHTKNSLINPHQLLREMARVRARGYAVENFEDNPYVYSVAAPIHDAHGRICAGVCVLLFSADIVADQLPALTERVVLAARRISHMIGYQAAPGGNAGEPAALR